MNVSPNSCTDSYKTGRSSAVWKNYRICSLNVSEWEETFHCFLQEEVKHCFRDQGNFWDENKTHFSFFFELVQWLLSVLICIWAPDPLQAAGAQRCSSRTSLLKDCCAKNWIILATHLEQYAENNFLQEWRSLQLCTFWDKKQLWIIFEAVTQFLQ